MSSDEPLLTVILTVRDGLTQIVEGLNQVLERYAPETKIPQVDLGELEQLPWVAYKTKEPAAKGQAAWIFTNTKGAEELVKGLRAAADHTLDLGEYTFQLQGKDLAFISRRPRKVEK